MNIRICYSRSAKKFIEKNSDKISQQKVNELILRAIQKILGSNINIDIKKLEGKYKGLYRIRTGNIRIIFSIRTGVIHIVVVEDIGFRGNIY